MEIPVPLGDVIDRITILRIKTRRLRDESARDNARRELTLLEERWAAGGHGEVPETPALEAVNEELWAVEDALRELERWGDFGERFVDLARSVYRLNDRRAALKRAVNQRLRSELVEEKQHPAY